jgi:hypothetical protein
MRAQYRVRHDYTGLGNQDTYSFDFQITNKSQLRVIKYDADDVLEFSVDGNNLVYLSSVTFNATAGGGSVVLAEELPEGHTLILLMANEAPTQPSRLRNKGDWTLRGIEAMFDFIAGPIQYLMYLALRSVRLPDIILPADFDTTLPQGITDDDNENRTLIVNSTHTGWDLGPTSSQIEDAAAEAAAAAASATAAAGSATAAAASASAASGSATAAASSAAAAAASSGVLTTTIATGNGSTTSYNTGVALAAVNFVMVFIDTFYQDPTTYTKSGTNIVFGEAPLNGSNIVMLVGSVNPDVATALAAAQAAQAAAVIAQAAAETAATNALTAENNAETAETNAELAETNAETAETNAETAEANAVTARNAAQAAQAAAEAAAASAAAAVRNIIGYAEYANDAAYVTANGAAGEGDTYYDTALDAVKAYMNAAWRTIGAYNIEVNPFYNDTLYWGATLPAIIGKATSAAGAFAIKTEDSAADTKTLDISVTSGHNNAGATAAVRSGHAYYGSGYVSGGAGGSGISQLASGNVTTGTSGDTKVKSGNASGAGTSGHTVIDTGTTSGGTRGKIKLKGGTEGTSGHVWTSTGTDGEGAWAAAGGGALVATGTFAAPSAIVAGTGVAYVEGQNARQIWFVEGSGGAVDISANPQIAAATTLGRELILYGCSDTNTVLLEDATGLVLNGPMTLYAHSMISFLWNGSNWSEMWRKA